MDIYRAERMAQDRAMQGKDWDKSFALVGPFGDRIGCEWLDPYFGMFTINGQEGFVMTRQIPADVTVDMSQSSAQPASPPPSHPAIGDQS